jgi:hypothetical protein
MRTIENPNEFGFYIATNRHVSGDLALRFVQELISLARTEQHFGPTADIEIAELGRGSFRTKLVFWGTALATIGSFALQVEERITATEEYEIAKCVAQMALETGAAKVTLMTCEGPIDVLRDEIPAVDAFLEARRATPEVSNWSEYFRKPTQQGGFGSGAYGQETLGAGNASDVSPGPDRITDPTRRPSKRVSIVRTDKGYPATASGRPVLLLGGEVPFGTNSFPENTIQYLLMDEADRAVAMLGKDAGAIGRFKFTVTGRFERDGDGTLYFLTGGSVFRAELVGLSTVPLAQSVSVTAVLDEAEPSVLEIHGMSIDVD